MSSMTLYRETLCEHGYMESHYTCDQVVYPEFDKIEHTQENCHCPGGSREEVTINIQAAIHTFDDWYRVGEPEEWMAKVVNSALGE